MTNVAMTSASTRSRARRKSSVSGRGTRNGAKAHSSDLLGTLEGAPAPRNVVKLMNVAVRESPARAATAASAVVAAANANADPASVRALLQWSHERAVDSAERRRTVCAAFKARKSNLLLVHGISELSPDEAAEYMRAYFAGGGDMKAVAQWLSIAGAVLRQNEAVRRARAMAGPRGKRATRRAQRRQLAALRRQLKGWGFIGDAVDAIGDALGSAGDAVGNAVGNVVDAVLSAGKSVGDAVAAAATWTVDQTKDLVRGLIAAGRAVASILDEALGRGLLRKFVEALIAAGRAVGEVLAWAAGKAVGVVQQALGAVLALGRSIGELLAWVVNQADAVLDTFLRALRAIGKTVAELVTAALQLTAAALRRVVSALYAIVRGAGEILVAVARCTVSVLRTVLEGLLMVGVTLAQAVLEICTKVADAFRRGFFQGLVALGYAVVDILKAAAAAGGSILALAVAVVMEMFGGHRGLTAAEMVEARRAFGWSIELERVKVAVASLPADVVNYLNGNRAFTTMYVINFASWDQVSMHDLIHELTHVWQAAGGPMYMVEALHSQFFGRGYDVTPEDIAAANGDIRKLEREQQAVVVERYWWSRWGGSTAWNWRDYEALAKCVYRPNPATGRIPVPIVRPRPQILPIRVEDFIDPMNHFPSPHLGGWR